MTILLDIYPGKVLLYSPILREGNERVKNGDPTPGEDLGTISHLKRGHKNQKFGEIQRTNVIARSEAKAILSNFAIK